MIRQTHPSAVFSKLFLTVISKLPTALSVQFQRFFYYTHREQKLDSLFFLKVENRKLWEDLFILFYYFNLYTGAAHELCNWLAYKRIQMYFLKKFRRNKQNTWQQKQFTFKTASHYFLAQYLQEEPGLSPKTANTKATQIWGKCYSIGQVLQQKRQAQTYGV